MTHVQKRVIAVVIAAMTALTGPAFAAGSSDGSSDEGTSAYAQAQTAIAAKDYAAAVPILTGLTRQKPRNADAWNLLGFSSRKLGDFDTAAAAYAKALSLDPAHLGALEYQGEMFVQLGQKAKARENLVRLQSLCDDCEEAEDLKAAIDAAG